MLITVIGNLLILNLVQVIFGSMLAIIIYKILTKRPKGFRSEIALIAIFPLCGILLPLDAFGVIPIAVALIAVGFKYNFVIPLIFSNALFNMLVPFNDPTFIWERGVRRVIVAYLAGLLIGLILKKLDWEEESYIKLKDLPKIDMDKISKKDIIIFIKKNIDVMGIYLLLGVILETIFHRYVLVNTVAWLYSNKISSGILYNMSGRDVVNPYFLLTMTIIYMLINMTKLFAMLRILKIKGIVTYFGLYMLIAGLLSISAFI